MNAIISKQNELFANLQEELGKDTDLNLWLQKNIGLSPSRAKNALLGLEALSNDEFFKILELNPKVVDRMSDDEPDDHPFEDFAMIPINKPNCEQIFQNYLQDLLKIFDKALNNKEFCTLKIVARDVPFFYFFSEPRLLEFQYAICNSYLYTEGLKSLSAETHRLAQEVHQRFMSIASKELWNPDAFKEQWHRLSLALEEQSLTKEQHDLVASDLEKLETRLKQQTLLASKPKGHLFELFHLNDHSMTNFSIFHTASEKLLISASPFAQFTVIKNPDLSREYLALFCQYQRSATPVNDEITRIFEGLGFIPLPMNRL